MIKRLTNNWSLKLAALVIALFLWGHVRERVNPWEIARFQVPLEAQAPQGTTLGPTSRLPHTVTVTVRGPRLALRSLMGPTPPNPLNTIDAPFPLSTGQISAEVDFDNVRPGVQSFAIKAHTKLRELDAIGVVPSEVRLDVRDVGIDRPFLNNDGAGG